MKKQTIGILGGMGPAATVDIFSKIVQNTPATKDEDHIRILIDNNPQIPSRVEAILHEGESPVPVLKEMAKGLERSGADFIIVPCNTASYYTEEVQKAVKIPILSIVEETSKYIIEKFGTTKTVGVLGTEMTERLGLYQKYLIESEVDVICKKEHCVLATNVVNYVRKRYPSAIGMFLDEDQMRLRRAVRPDNSFNIVAPYLDTLKKYVTKAIFGKHGIKAGDIEHPRKQIIKAIKELKNHGAGIIILGCTELPLVITEDVLMEMPIIDPTLVLAKKAIEKALGKEQSN